MDASHRESTNIVKLSGSTSQSVVPQDSKSPVNKIGDAIGACVGILDSLSLKEKITVINGLAGMVNLTTYSKFGIASDGSNSGQRSTFASVVKQPAVIQQGQRSSLRKPVLDSKAAPGPSKKSQEVPKTPSKKRKRETPPKPNPANKSKKVIDLKAKLVEVRSKIAKAIKDEPKVGPSKGKLTKEHPLILEQTEILGQLMLAKGSFCSLSKLSVDKSSKTKGSPSSFQEFLVSTGDPGDWSEQMDVEESSAPSGNH
jgi:hypothetical protein